MWLIFWSRFLLSQGFPEISEALANSLGLKLIQFLKTDPNSLVLKTLINSLSKTKLLKLQALINSRLSQLEKMMPHNQIKKFIRPAINQFNQFKRETTEKVQFKISTLFSETQALSSSWIAGGDYTRAGGILTIYLHEGRFYTYFNVSSFCWEKMKDAKGMYGTGAGSAFWKYYLHHYIHGEIGKTTLRKQARARYKKHYKHLGMTYKTF